MGVGSGGVILNDWGRGMMFRLQEHFFLNVSDCCSLWSDFAFRCLLLVICGEVVVATICLSSLKDQLQPASSPILLHGSNIARSKDGTGVSYSKEI